MKQFLTIFFLYASFMVTAQEPERFLSIKISANQLKANDTISIEANYVDDYNEPRDGTLFLKILNDAGKVWKYRWPIVKGFSYPELVIPAALKDGHYQFYFATRDETFAIKGVVDNVSDVKKLNSLLNNKESLIVTNNIEVNNDGSFTYTNPYFINNAVLKFVNKEKKGDKPNLKIIAVLDSSFVPTATAFTKIAIGNVTELGGASNLPKTYMGVDSFLLKNVYTKGVITVKGKKKSPAQDFSDKYISDLFKDQGETTIDVLSDNPGQYGTTAIQYLLNNVPNLNIGKDDNGDDIITWRGTNMSIYLDQILLQNDFIQNIDLNDIAVIKIFRPPFFGNSNADGGGAIAFFSKKDGFGKVKSTFTVNGYSHILSTFTSTPNNFW
jgi:hypothetical protein